MIIADIHLKKKDLEQALMAYLRIPVFYGTQVQRVPDAEMKAAQTLVRMKRYEDAQTIFARLADTYKGSAIAQAAEKEKAAINGMKNEPEQDETAAEEKKG
jgi:TolA-binding protein